MNIRRERRESHIGKGGVTRLMNKPFHIDLEQAREVLAPMGFELTARQVKRSSDMDAHLQRSLCKSDQDADAGYQTVRRNDTGAKADRREHLLHGHAPLPARPTRILAVGG